VNIDRLWSLMPEGVYEKAKASASSDVAPVIDVTKLVRFLILFAFFLTTLFRATSRFLEKDFCPRSLLS
jgi:predicted PurR-regulated permease PerM